MSNSAKNISKTYSKFSEEKLNRFQTRNIFSNRLLQHGNDEKDDELNQKLDREFTKLHYIMRNFPNYGRVAKTADYTASTRDHIIGVTDTSSPRTVTLPLASKMQKGQFLVIKDESGAAGTNNITIDGDGSETIDGSATIVINSNYGTKRIYSDGSNWFTA